MKMSAGFPEKSDRLFGERRSNEPDELSCLHGSEKGIVCDDEAKRRCGEIPGQEYKNEVRKKRQNPLFDNCPHFYDYDYYSHYRIAFMNTAPTLRKVTVKYDPRSTKG